MKLRFFIYSAVVNLKRNLRACRPHGRIPGLPAALLGGVIWYAASACGQTPGAGQDVQSSAPPIAISLDEAIHRAEANEPTFATALADSKVAGLDRSIARAGMLPSAVFHNQGLYTQPNGLQNQAGQGVGSQPSPIFIANNAVREYASQAVVNETLSLGQVAAVRHADAAAAQAAAELEIARRGLVAAVTGLYFGVAAADKKLAIAEQANAEAAAFTKLTSQREEVREAAHADTVKAQLQQQQRERELSDARLAAEKARLELGVLLFPDPRTRYEVSIPADAPTLAIARRRGAGRGLPQRGTEERAGRRGGQLRQMCWLRAQHICPTSASISPTASMLRSWP